MDSYGNGGTTNDDGNSTGDDLIIVQLIKTKISVDIELILYQLVCSKLSIEQ